MFMVAAGIHVIVTIHAKEMNRVNVKAAYVFATAVVQEIHHVLKKHHVQAMKYHVKVLMDVIADVIHVRITVIHRLYVQREVDFLVGNY